MNPINFGAETLSNKRYAILRYYLTNHTVLKKTLFGHKYVDSGKYWVHISTSWYKSQKSQRQALDDFIRKMDSDKYKFVPYTNNFNQMPSMKVLPYNIKKS